MNNDLRSLFYESHFISYTSGHYSLKNSDPRSYFYDPLVMEGVGVVFYRKRGHNNDRGCYSMGVTLLRCTNLNLALQAHCGLLNAVDEKKKDFKCNWSPVI